MHKILFLFFCINSLVLRIQGQNLITNGGFEITGRCPRDITLKGYKIVIDGWYIPSKATPDIFNLCSTGLNSVPNNFIGRAFPFEGDGYAGLCVFKRPQTSYREYLGAKLVQPLFRGQNYQLIIAWRLANYSKLAIDTLQVILTEDSVYNTSDELISAPLKSTAFSLATNHFNNNNGWKLDTINFTAKGEERFMTIGNFKSAVDISYKSNFNRGKGIISEAVAYYYIDNIQLLPIDSLPFKLEYPFYLENLIFNFDSYTIDEAAYFELNKLGKFMSDNPSLVLYISGHADKVGAKEYNLNLSYQRALQVKNYLLQFNLNNKIIVNGYGNRVLTDRGDEFDRRVEFKILFEKKYINSPE